MFLTFKRGTSVWEIVLTYGRSRQGEFKAHSSKQTLGTRKPSCSRAQATRESTPTRIKIQATTCYYLLLLSFRRFIASLNKNRSPNKVALELIGTSKLVPLRSAKIMLHNDLHDFGKMGPCSFCKLCMPYRYSFDLCWNKIAPIFRNNPLQWGGAHLGPKCLIGRITNEPNESVSGKNSFGGWKGLLPLFLSITLISQNYYLWTLFRLQP